MATQRYISTAFWTDKWIRTLDPSERYMYLYLLTNPQTNIAGVYQLTLDRMAFDTGYDERTLRPMIYRFEKAGKAYLYNDEWVIIPAWPKHQKAAEHGKIAKGIRTIISHLPADVYEKLEQVEYAFIGDDGQPEEPNKRKKIKSGQRNRILERDGHKCVFCGSPSNLEIDHIQPVSMGGDNLDSNLRVLCQECNGKRNAEIRWNPDGTLSMDTQKNGLPINYLNLNSDINLNINSDIESVHPSEDGTAAPITKPRKKFVKPSLQEVSEYCTERRNGISPEKFLDYYEANGWRVGRNPMKDWRAAVRNWEQNEKVGGKNASRPSGRKDPWDEPGYYENSGMREARGV